ncbi:hypothetical protein CRUP_031322 [Coryphaenoides rupestris]|nr:hypothetical protein CRUP_031322 [Coryphaenoides rupestris]
MPRKNKGIFSGGHSVARVREETRVAHRQELLVDVMRRTAIQNACHESPYSTGLFGEHLWVTVSTPQHPWVTASTSGWPRAPLASSSFLEVVEVTAESDKHAKDSAAKEARRKDKLEKNKQKKLVEEVKTLIDPSTRGQSSSPVTRERKGVAGTTTKKKKTNTTTTPRGRRGPAEREESPVISQTPPLSQDPGADKKEAVWVTHLVWVSPLFGNRSFCYERLQQYEWALWDAEAALDLEPQWVKGLFRRGKALCGLKRYYEASLTYKDILKQESSSAEALQELKRAQTLHLMEMGFSWEQSCAALKEHASLEEAVVVVEEEEEEDDDDDEEKEEEGEWIVLGGRSRTPQGRRENAASAPKTPAPKTPSAPKR